MKTHDSLIQEILKKTAELKQQILDAPLDSGAADNLNHDLDFLLQRLRAGAFAETDFAGRNLFDIPRRTREFFRYFFGYYAQAQTWAAILAECNLSQAERVIDLCPGWAPKIEWALQKLGYTGEVVIYDKSASALENVGAFMELFSPAYTLRRVQGDLQDEHKPVASVVVANHVIDDVLLSHFADLWGYDQNTLYESEKTYAELALRIAAAEPERKNFQEKLFSELMSFVAPGGIFIATHYPSLTEEFLGLTSWTKTCADMLLALRAHFVEAGFVDFTHDLAKCVDRLASPYFSAQQFVALRRKALA